MSLSFASSMPTLCTKALVFSKVCSGSIGITTCKPFLPEVLMYGVSPKSRSLSLSSRATSAASLRLRAVQGQHQRTASQACLNASILEKGMWISSAAKFASQISVSKSLQTM